MIKVIVKTFEILNLVAKNRKASLADIALALGENKTTVANILRTLVDLGQLKKDESNYYLLGPDLLRLALADHKRNTLSGLAEEIARDLAGEIGETTVVAAMDSGERVTVAEGYSNRDITVNAGAFTANSAYDKATGRVLLAWMPEPELADYIEHHGLPGSEEWPEAVTENKLAAALARIRKDGIEIKVPGNREVQALAVPVMGSDGTCWASVGCYLPLMRFEGSHKEDVVRGVRQAGEKMSRRLALLHG